MANLISITDFSALELDAYARLSEVQLRRFYEPDTGLFIAESPKVIERALNAGYEPVSMLVEEKHVTGEAKEIVARVGEIPVHVSQPEVLTKLTGFQLTRGALCLMRRRHLPSLEEICAGESRIAVLENVVNPTNVGAIFRSAAALYMDAVVLTSPCSDPLYRRAARVSMGTVFQVPWTYCDSRTVPVARLQEMGFKTAAMALCSDSVNIDDPNLMAEEKLAVILGTEGEGLAEEPIAACDYKVCIPMSHGVDSLNVAAASAIAFWQVRKQQGSMG